MFMILRILSLFWWNCNLFTGDSAVQDNLTFIWNSNSEKCHILVTNIFFQNFKAPKLITLSPELSNLALSFHLKRKQIFSLFEILAQFHLKIAEEQRRPSKHSTWTQSESNMCLVVKRTRIFLGNITSAVKKSMVSHFC